MTINLKADNDKIYTPSHIVDKILDNVGYNNPSILMKKIVDHSCGDGNFLEAIVRRIVSYSTPSDLKANLECIYGFDVDQQAIDKCVERLNTLVPNISVDWNIQCKNSLKNLTDLYGYFDYVVGNPPYIRVHNLDNDTKDLLKYNYEFCKSGSTDIYLAFFELSLNLINDNGVISMITPNSFIITAAGKKLRNYLIDNQSLISITNYGSVRVFDHVGTYTAITTYNKKKNDKFKCYLHSTLYEYEVSEIEHKLLSNAPFWNLKNPKSTKGNKLKDVCNISSGIATLCDKGFIIIPFDETENTFKFKSRMECNINQIFEVEKNILKPIIKASKYKRTDEIKEYIIFPYKKDINNKYKVISEEELIAYPKTYEYLKSIKENHLDKRDKEKENKKYKWYEFGRDQAVNTGFGKKIIFSPMNIEPNFILCENEDATVYSGYFIKTDMDYYVLLDILNSVKMKEYIDQNGGNFGGGWKSYSKKILNNFPID